MYPRLRHCLFYSFLLLASCGIDGEPIAPAEKPKKTSTKPKLSESDPMVAEGADMINVAPLDKIQRFGTDYDSNFDSNLNDLEELFEQIKPESAQPRTMPEEPL